MRLINALVIAVLATALMTVPSVAQTYGDHPHMGAWGWGGTIFGPIMMIVFIAVVVVAPWSSSVTPQLDDKAANQEVADDDRY